MKKKKTIEEICSMPTKQLASELTIDDIRSFSAKELRKPFIALTEEEKKTVESISRDYMQDRHACKLMKFKNYGCPTLHDGAVSDFIAYLFFVKNVNLIDIYSNNA